MPLWQLVDNPRCHSVSAFFGLDQTLLADFLWKTTSPSSFCLQSLAAISTHSLRLPIRQLCPRRQPSICMPLCILPHTTSKDWSRSAIFLVGRPLLYPSVLSLPAVSQVVYLLICPTACLSVRVTACLSVQQILPILLPFRRSVRLTAFPGRLSVG